MKGKERINPEITGERKGSRRSKSTASNIGNYIGAHASFILLIVLMAFLLAGPLLASGSSIPPSPPGTGTADTLWNEMRDLIGTWVTRLGGVVMFVGGVMFGLGWKNDDAEQKSRGISTLIAGAIVTAVAAGVSMFFQ